MEERGAAARILSHRRGICRAPDHRSLSNSRAAAGLVAAPCKHYAEIGGPLLCAKFSIGYFFIALIAVPAAKLSRFAAGRVDPVERVQGTGEQRSGG